MQDHDVVVVVDSSMVAAAVAVVVAREQDTMQVLDKHSMSSSFVAVAVVAVVDL